MTSRRPDAEDDGPPLFGIQPPGELYPYQYFHRGRFPQFRRVFRDSRKVGAWRRQVIIAALCIPALVVVFLAVGLVVR